MVYHNEAYISALVWHKFVRSERSRTKDFGSQNWQLFDMASPRLFPHCPIHHHHCHWPGTDSRQSIINTDWEQNQSRALLPTGREGLILCTPVTFYFNNSILLVEAADKQRPKEKVSYYRPLSKADFFRSSFSSFSYLLVSDKWM